MNEVHLMGPMKEKFGSWKTLTHYHFSFNLDFISFLSLVHFHLIMDEVHLMTQLQDNLDLDQT
jgi:hypothetical protein